MSDIIALVLMLSAIVAVGAMIWRQWNRPHDYGDPDL